MYGLWYRLKVYEDDILEGSQITSKTFKEGVSSHVLLQLSAVTKVGKYGLKSSNKSWIVALLNLNLLKYELRAAEKFFYPIKNQSCLIAAAPLL